MKNTIRCCISCILPCGALDVIRIVHSNGRVEEISGTIKAIDVMKANPKHILKKPSSAIADDEGGEVPKIVMVPPEAELQRGKIYFLMPLPSQSPMPEKKNNQHRRKRRKEHTERGRNNNIISNNNNNNNNNNNISMTNFLVSDRYLSDILSEKLSMQRDVVRRSRGRVAVWRPHLESISELPCDM